MDTRHTAVSWGLGTVAWLFALVAVGPIVGESPLATAAEALIDASPGALATAAIDTLGAGAKPAAVLGTSAAAVVAGVAFGLALTRATERGGPLWDYADGIRVAVGASIVALTAGALYWSADEFSLRWLLATGLALVPVSGFAWVRSWHPPASGRRRALRELGTAFGGAAGVALLARTLRDERSGPEPGTDLDMLREKREVGETTPTGRGATVASDPGTATPTPASGGRDLETVRETEGVTVSEARTREDFGFDFEGMPERIGDADSHYVVDKAINKPTPDADEWSLSITGAVEEPYELDYADLLDHPEAREVPLTMVCISNSVGGGLIATTTWRAIPFQALLAEAGVPDGAGDVVTHALDGYAEAVPWSVVRDEPEISIAFGMDGRTLPVEHGFPARLQVPGRYGMRSTKWLDRIEVATGDRESYYEERGWDAEAVINTLSYLRAAQRRGDRVAVGGVAFAGGRGIRRVDVSVDGGETWAAADLEDAPGEFAWRRWRQVFDRPDTGSIELVTRAADGEGVLQTSDRTDPAPAGATGWHRVGIRL